MTLTGFETTLLGVIVSFAFSIFGFVMGRTGTVSAKVYEANRREEEKQRTERIAAEMAKCRDREVHCREREETCRQELAKTLGRIEIAIARNSEEHAELHDRITKQEGRISKIEGVLCQKN